MLTLAILEYLGSEHCIRYNQINITKNCVVTIKQQQCVLPTCTIKRSSKSDVVDYHIFG